MGRYFRAESNGNGDITLQGSIDELDIDQAGNGNIYARQLEAKVAKEWKKRGMVNIYNQIRNYPCKPMAEAMVMMFNGIRCHSSFVRESSEMEEYSKSKKYHQLLCPFSILPLQFGYFTAWLYAFCFEYRGYKEELLKPIFHGIHHVFFRHGNPGLYLWFCRHQCVIGKDELAFQDIFIWPVLQPFIYTSVLKRIKIPCGSNVHGITFLMLCTLFLI